MDVDGDSDDDDDVADVDGWFSWSMLDSLLFFVEVINFCLIWS